MIDWWAFYGITAFILFVGFINGFWIGWLVCFFNRVEIKKERLRK
mgnify:CR=1 FL=1|tara:strand:- start:542 stop:676 length:135 start_codon:yes stop_codon:yes gene_type:complete